MKSASARSPSAIPRRESRKPHSGATPACTARRAFPSSQSENPMYWLGIDIGTGGTRALLVDEKGTCKAGFTSPHEDMRMEKPLWAEQRPEDWWQAAQKAIQGVLAEAKIKGNQVK